jgi:hypothetical protein
MAGPVVLGNPADTWTNSEDGYQNKNYGSTTILRLKSGGNNRRTWMYFGLPFPPGCTIVNATLYLRTLDNWPSGVTLSVQKANAAWSVNKITDSNKPSVMGPIATAGPSNWGQHDTITVNVTALLQEVANGGAWYGFRITASGDENKELASSQNGTAWLRPALVITWVDAPRPPTYLSPSGNRALATGKPILSFNYVDPSADSPLNAVQVQIDPTGNWAAPAWDSGVVGTSIPQLDLNATSYPGLAPDASTYWRVRVQDAGGLWSGWSHVASGQGAQFRNVAMGNVTIIHPADPPNNFIYDPTPAITWSFDKVQKHWQVLFTDYNDPGNVLHNSGKISGPETTYTPPLSVLMQTDKEYKVIVRIWDTTDREQNGSTPIYAEGSKDFTFAYDGTVLPITDFLGTLDPVVPKISLTWSRLDIPDWWAIIRDGQVIDYVSGDALQTGPTTFRYDDFGAGGRQTHTWIVRPIVDGAWNDGPEFTANIIVNFPWLFRQDGSDPVALYNPQRDMFLRNSQELHDVVGDHPPVLITQVLGGMAGHLEGIIVDNIIPNVSAKEMRDNFMSIRRDAGTPMQLMLLDESMLVVPYNMTYSPLSSPNEGMAYKVSFDWVAVR